MHDHLPDDQHLHDGICQCRCNDCYARLIGACVCMDCACDAEEREQDEDAYVAAHSWLYEQSLKE